MISVRSMSCYYGDKNILNNISFEAKEGDILNVLGRNGVGKSTLFKSLLNILKYDGEYFIDGIDVKNLNTKNLSRFISYVPQNLKLNFNHRVFDIVLMGYAPEIGFYESPNKKQKINAMKVMEDLGIATLKNRYFLQLSGGQQQLVLIAKAMVLGTKILVMDEPLSNLDFGNQMKIVRNIKRLSEKGMCVIISMHNPMLAFLLGGKSILLNDKKIMAYGATEDVINSENLSKLYSIDVEVEYVYRYGKKIGFCYPLEEI